MENSVYKSLERIRSHLMNTTPLLGQSLDEFIRHIDSSDPSKKQIWENTAFPPRPVPYAELGFDIAQTNCRNVHQTIVRTKKWDVVRFKVFTNMINRIKTKQTLMQYSFALVHEWLWDVLPDDEEGIRKVNSYLHSKFFLKHTDEEVSLSLQQLAPGRWKEFGESGISLRTSKTILQEREKLSQLVLNHGENLRQIINEQSQLCQENYTKEKSAIAAGLVNFPRHNVIAMFQSLYDMTEAKTEAQMAANRYQSRTEERDYYRRIAVDAHVEIETCKRFTDEVSPETK